MIGLDASRTGIGIIDCARSPACVAARGLFLFVAIETELRLRLFFKDFAHERCKRSDLVVCQSRKFSLASPSGQSSADLADGHHEIFGGVFRHLDGAPDAAHGLLDALIANPAQRTADAVITAPLCQNTVLPHSNSPFRHRATRHFN